MAKKGQAERRAQKREQKDGQKDGSMEQKKAAQSPKGCEITGCEHEGFAIGCCQKKICTQCLYNTVRVCECERKFTHKCPFCNQILGMEDNLVKKLMAMHCPSHAKVIDGCHNHKFVVAHSPCDAESCYDCEFSHLHVRAL